MKKRIVSLIAGAALLGSAGALLGQHQPNLEQLPHPVQTAIQRELRTLPDAEVKHFERDIRNGREEYLIEFRMPGPNERIRVAPDGTRLQERGRSGLFGAITGQRPGQIEFRDLPQAVQNTVRAEAGDANIDDISHITRNGRTVYDVEFVRGGRNVELHVSETGAILSRYEQPLRQAGVPGGVIGRPAEGARLVTFGALPRPVQQTVSAQVEMQDIQQIEQQIFQGRPAYQVSFLRAGRPGTLMIAQDGRVLQRGGVALDVGRPGEVISRGVGVGEGRPVQFEALTPPVQQAIRTRLAGANVQSIHQVAHEGEVRFVVNFEDQGGVPAQIHVAQDGRLVRDREGDVDILAGLPMTDTPQQMGSKQNIEFDQVPAAVQRAARLHARGAEIEDVDRGLIAGQVVYEVAFKRNGYHIELRVAEDGRVIEAYNPDAVAQAAAQQP